MDKNTQKENHVIYSSIKTIFKSLWNTFNQEGEKSVHWNMKTQMKEIEDINQNFILWAERINIVNVHTAQSPL